MIKTLVLVDGKIDFNILKSEYLKDSIVISFDYLSHKSLKDNNIEQALQLLESSKILKDYLTDEYIKIFVDLKRKEQESFNSEISDLEYNWYLNL